MITDQDLQALDVLREIRDILRVDRAARSQLANVVNAQFDVVQSNFLIGSNDIGRVVVSYNPLRVFLLFSVGIGGVAVLVVEGGDPDWAGITVAGSVNVTFTLRDAPGLVSSGWLIGNGTSLDTKLYILEIIDRRRR